MDPTNWNLFKAKNNNKESKAFETMCYLLFCAEFDNRIGLFRYRKYVKPAKRNEEFAQKIQSDFKLYL